MDTTTIAALTAGVMALVEAIKHAGLPSRWAPLAALGAGIVVGLGYWLAFGGDAGELIWSGILAAIGAAGLYSGGKSIVQGS